MILDFDELRDFALTFVDKMVEDKHIESDIDTDEENEFDIQDTLIQHFIDRFKQDDCLTPNNTDKDVPLGIFTIFYDAEQDERPYVCVNYTVEYLDSL